MKRFIRWPGIAEPVNEPKNGCATSSRVGHDNPAGDLYRAEGRVQNGGDGRCISVETAWPNLTGDLFCYNSTKQTFS